MKPQRKVQVRVSELRARIADWSPILRALAPELEQALERLGRHVPCPRHGGVDGFRLFKDRTGGGVCNSCGSFPDGFEVLRWLRGWSFPRTLEAVDACLGGTSTAFRVALVRPIRPLADPAEDERRRQTLNRVWREAWPADQPGAEPLRLYLSNRGLPYRAYPKALRFHPGLAYYEGKQKVGVYPAMVALVADAGGRPITLHRTYLSRDGHKALVAEPKKLMAYPSDRRLSGGAIRLYGDVQGELAIAEGIETSLAVRHLTGGRPVWAAITAGLMERLIVPDRARLVRVWADNDSNGCGQAAAQRLAKQLRAQGRDVEILLPSIPIPPGAKKVDWLDVLQVLGLESIRDMAAARAA